ncbi:hypothetical protein [Mangrovicella endophytica]|uniref:hypothetical protein n=1 Tax=Mangrovicella endophytica TaxID=2066697 RepID=UPI000C9E5035|nr:hypothetical protein [Mangrovicella endophytica]
MVGRVRVVLHGGMHKTGTTSLQAALLSCRDALAASGIWYPRGEVRQAAQLINVKRADWSPEPIARVIAECQRGGAHTLLLSLESISTFSALDFKRLTACFEDCELAYVFVFRHWATYLPSRWSQYIKRRDSQTCADYVAGISRSEHPDHRFDLIVERALASGPCRVEAVSYDRAVEDQGSVLPAVIRAIGLPEALGHTIAASASWRHRTGGRERLEVTRLLNGALADRLGLPQDDNVRAVGEGRLSDVFFDLDPAELPRAEFSAIVQLGRSTSVRQPIAAGFIDAGMRLEAHRRLFADLGGLPIFPDYLPVPVESWSLDWTAIAARQPVRDFVARMRPIVEERMTARLALLR